MMDLGRLKTTWTNRQRPERAEAIGPLLGRIRAELSHSKGRQWQEVGRAWLAVVPSDMGKTSRILGLKRGELRVAVGSPTDVYMVQTVQHDTLVSSMNKLLGRTAVERIRCELG